MKNAESSAFKVPSLYHLPWVWGRGLCVNGSNYARKKNTNFSFNKIPEGLWRYKKKYFDAKQLDAL